MSQSEDMDIQQMNTNASSRMFHAQVLSQRLGQLSRSKSANQQSISRLEKVPKYLSNQNESYNKLMTELYFELMFTAASTVTSSTSMGYEDSLRQIALLLHKTTTLQILRSLWMTFLKSGTGQLHMTQRGPSVWPPQVKMILRKTHRTIGNENDACLQLVHERLDKFRTNIRQYEIQLDDLKHRLQDNKFVVLRRIETFIQQSREEFSRQIEHKIKLVQFDYYDRILELEFLEQKPSKFCIKLYKSLYNARYKQDITKEEVPLVNERIWAYKKNGSEYSEPVISQPSFISTSLNQSLQKQTFDELESAFEQAKRDLLNLCHKTAEIQMQTYEKEYNKAFDRMFIARKQVTLPIENQLTPSMLHVLEQRANNRKERIKCVNQYKIHCLHKISHQ